MNSDTTVNVHSSIMERIEEAAEKTNVKRNYIVILLLKYAMKDNKKYSGRISFRRVKYQKADPLKRYKPVHVWFPEEVSLFCYDMRRIYSMSVSYILAKAVRVWLDEIVLKLLKIDDEENITDNYLFMKSDFNRKVLKNGICWKLYWKKTKET